MITDTILYVGVNDRKIDLFEGQYKVPDGMSYNSYVIYDQKIAVTDTVDARFTSEWLDNIEKVLGGKQPDYLIIQHMEPDHSANIHNFMQKYPEAVIVSNDRSFAMMQGYFETDYSDRRISVKDGDTLCLGKHTLTFYSTPMVHWPEVMMTYDSYDKVLFSADAFGTFGALDSKSEWLEQARRYYIGIVGKFGAQVQRALSKLGTLDISKICPLHGPVLDKELGYYINLYNIWSSYAVEKEGVAVCYTSVYGNTKKAVGILVDELKRSGCPDVAVYDLARCDMSEAVASAFSYGKLVLATTTYNTDIFPFMREFVHELVERNYQNRTVAIIENGSWAPTAANVIKKLLGESKNITFTDTVTIRAAVKAEDEKAIKELSSQIL